MDESVVSRYGNSLAVFCVNISVNISAYTDLGIVAVDVEYWSVDHLTDVTAVFTRPTPSSQRSKYFQPMPVQPASISRVTHSALGWVTVTYIVEKIHRVGIFWAEYPSWHLANSIKSLLIVLRPRCQSLQSDFGLLTIATEKLVCGHIVVFLFYLYV